MCEILLCRCKYDVLYKKIIFQLKGFHSQANNKENLKSNNLETVLLWVLFESEKQRFLHQTLQQLYFC